MHLIGHGAFLLALLGCGFFLASGGIAAFLLPVLAASAPAAAAPVSQSAGSLVRRTAGRRAAR